MIVMPRFVLFSNTDAVEFGNKRCSYIVSNHNILDQVKVCVPSNLSSKFNEVKETVIWMGPFDVVNSNIA